MEALKALSTGVHSVPGYGVIFYRLFTVSSESHGTDTSERELLELAEAELHKQGHLAVKDVDNGCLWLFENRWNGDLITETPKEATSPVLEDVTLDLLASGLLKLFELPRPRARLRATLVASNKSPISPAVSSLPAQIENAKAVRANGRTREDSSDSSPQVPELDTFLILPWFIAAVEASVSFQLADKLGHIPLNSRTWVTHPFQVGPAMTPPKEGSDAPLLLLVSMNAYVTTAGTLVMSFVTTSRPDMECILSDLDTHMTKSHIVRLAPNGVLAKLVPNNGSYDTAKKQTSSPSVPGSETSQHATHLHDLSWKQSVRKWLAHRGINLQRLEANDKWVAVQLSQESVGNAATKGKVVQCLWPAALCFGTRCVDAAITSDTTLGLQWYARAEQAYSDPIADAQDWFLGKAERQQAEELRKRTDTTAQEQAILLEQPMMFPASPLHTRMDLQASSGVYPTPPDGILTQPTPTAATADTPHQAHSTVNTHTAGDSAMEATPSYVATNAEEEPVSHDSPLGADKDLFGEMDIDDDNFGGNLSDGDFNFFDEPEDSPMPDKAEADKVMERPIDQPTMRDKALERDQRLDSTNANTTPHATSGFVPETPHEKLVSDSPNSPDQSIDQSTGPGMATASVSTAAAGRASSPILNRKQLLSDDVKQRFSNVKFHEQVTTADAKYASGGVFAYPSSSSKNSDTSRTVERDRLAATIAKRWTPSLEPSRRLSVSNDPANAQSTPFARMQDSSRTHNISLTGVVQSDIVDDSDTEDTTSTYSTDPFHVWDDEMQDDAPIDQRAIKRVRSDDDDHTHYSIISPNDKAERNDVSVPDFNHFALDIEADTVLALFEPDPADWSIANLPPPSQNQPEYTEQERHPLPDAPIAEDEKQDSTEDEPDLSPEAYIDIAQLVAHQSILSTLSTPCFDSRRLDRGNNDAAPCHSLQRLLDKASTTLLALFPDISQTDIAQYAQIQDAPCEPPPGLKAPARPLPRKPTNTMPGTDVAAINTPFKINPQHVRVKRSDSLWDLFPTALSFWEPLGLGPASGAKNVLAYCIYPDNDALVDVVGGFLDSVGSTYESRRLGIHHRGVVLQGFPSELIPISIPDNSKLTHSSVKAAWHKTGLPLGTALANLDINEVEKLLQDSSQTKADDSASMLHSIVIYMVDSFETPESVRDLCIYFWKLRDAYDKVYRSLSLTHRKPDLVLQIVPMRCIVSSNVPIFLNQPTLSALAREVYDRCSTPAPNASRSTLSIYAAPSIQLEENVPRTIPFRLVADPGGELLHDCSHLHIGYALSCDERWLTAAWTDGYGKYQATMSYSTNDRVFAEVAKEIWQTTIGIMQARRVTWRVTVAKAGVMERDELESWAVLVSGASPMPVGAVLMTIDPNPALQLTPTLSQPNQPIGATTPASTPQGMSPTDTALHTAATPSEAVQDAANDPDAHLVDVTDETWGVILSHHLSNSNSLTEIRPCLASGFLINKGGEAITNDDSIMSQVGPQCTGYNIIWIGSSRPGASAGTQGHQHAPQTPTSSQAPQTPTTAPPSQGQGAAHQHAGATTPASTSVPATASVTPRFGGATIDPFLKEYLTVYRGLGMLARLRGMKGTNGGTTPWHIVAALNSVAALERCMDS